MSSDNGIYVAKFPEGYRVAYASAIENITFYEIGTKARKEVLKSYFGDSPVFETEKLAFDYAYELYKNIEEEENLFGYASLEYGIGFIGEYESFL